ncbi:MAG TPA: 2-oxoacid:acceptor oxidoreductase family protein [Anaerolineaceae bacterium]|jgi:2-oxoglutarate ferredoxin oxidoreductase subunit gamma|nr:2-oxoacid:ferredoxin oxidoreductase subunit gamma [Chloroflexota bacterium]HNS07443.1 2-oxoacid:acceptor oxidoreductase family protein [Anaerolineaceae bacterium]HNW13375.1 2-oxoacid:acceptor oxidoreductase family protein [Anaerolineaceae bacterium]HOE02481.1 2-oxoacid:acceptor oxidoreductase family protein [Anaerolineaceae bacterium]HOQ69924.1 2-oxoacid:acceptor oxidoreductase family protein [Anaerolineaceae bacterium]
MQTEIITAGFGGQGVLFTGQLLTYAAMDEGREVTWIPSYGPEMRGGTANCTVVISDEEIGSPMVSDPQAVIAMNLPSLDKYEGKVRPGGVLVVNESMVDRAVSRQDIKVVMVKANEIAEELGDKRMMNMVLLGALIANLPVIPLQAIEKALAGHLPERHHKMLPKNYEALKRGAAHLAQ